MNVTARRIVVFDREFSYYGNIKEETLVRLLRHINFDGPNGCWLWTACRNSSGYGCAGHKGKSVLAHRFLWHVLTGRSLPSEIDLHHKTEAPTSCIGPQC